MIKLDIDEVITNEFIDDNEPETNPKEKLKYESN
jgi:hypothetical protein